MNLKNGLSWVEFCFVDMKCIGTWPAEKEEGLSQKRSLQLQNTFLIQVYLVNIIATKQLLVCYI